MQSYRLSTWAILLAAAFDGRLAAQDKASDWPAFRGLTGQGTSGAKGLPTEWSATKNVAWKTALPGPGTSSPIVVGARIYLTCYRGFNVPGQGRGDEKDLRLLLVCMSRDDGQVLWTKELAPSLPESDKIREGHGYASSTPAADGERLYTFFGKSGVVAFDFDGGQVWRVDVGSQVSGWGTAASPVLFNDLVIINASVESESLVALDKKTGKEVWRTRGIKESWNTPIVAASPGGEPELVVAIMGKVLGFNPTTGEQLWSCATDIGWYMVPSLVAHDGVVYCIGGRSGGGLAVRLGGRGNVTPSHRIWTSRKGSNVSSPLYHDGHLYWANDALAIVYCCEAKTGKIVYEERIPTANQFYASPVLADGKIYYVSRSGRTFVVAAKPQYESLAVNDVETRGMFNASPAVAGSSLLLRSERYLYCLGGK